MQASGRMNDRPRERNRDVTAMHAIIKDAASAGARALHEEFDPAKVIGANASQSDIDHAMATGNMTRVSAVATAESVQRGWDGLTPEQEAKVEQEHDEEVRREINDEMEENERLYQQTLREFDRQEDEIRKRMKAMEDETFHLHGRAVFIDQFGRPIYADGTLLEGRDKRDALDAKAKGQRFDDYNIYRQSNDQLNKLNEEKQKLIDQHAKNEQAVTGSGNNSDAQAAVDKDKQDILQARNALAAGRQARQESAAKAAAVATATTDGSDDDFFSIGDDTGTAAQPNTSTTSISTGRNTSVANQQLGPSLSGASAVPAFASVAPPKEVSTGTAPAATSPQKNVTAPSSGA